MTNGAEAIISAVAALKELLKINGLSDKFYIEFDDNLSGRALHSFIVNGLGIASDPSVWPQAPQSTSSCAAIRLMSWVRGFDGRSKARRAGSSRGTRTERVSLLPIARDLKRRQGVARVLPPDMALDPVTGRRRLDRHGSF